MRPTPEFYRGILVGYIHLLFLSICTGLDDVREALIPKILDTETDVSVNKGHTAKLNCKVENQGTKTVIWRRAEEPNPLTIGTYPYVTDKRIRTTHNKHTHEWKLHISRVELSDEGVYECQVSSKEHIVRHFRLTVTDDIEPEKENVPRVSLTGRKYVDVGEPIMLLCNATGEDDAPPHDLDWFKDGEKINAVAGSKIEITKYKYLPSKSIVSHLLIQHARLTDKGTYVCRTGSDDKDAADFDLLILNAATNNVKRGTEKDTEKVKDKPETKEVKDTKGERSDQSQNSGAISTLYNSGHPAYLITWTFVIMQIFHITLQAVERSDENSP